LQVEMLHFKNDIISK